jgi:membrane-associated phospholipid phosphatase
LRSFPSRALAAACAVAIVLGTFYPKLRMLTGCGLLLVSLVLLGVNAHFVSDTLAGLVVGLLAGAGALRLWDWLCPFFLIEKE